MLTARISIGINGFIGSRARLWVGGTGFFGVGRWQHGIFDRPGSLVRVGVGTRENGEDSA